jgi:hypothetical protein
MSTSHPIKVVHPKLVVSHIVTHGWLSATVTIQEKSEKNLKSDYLILAV